MEENIGCRHNNLIQIDTGTSIRAYICKDCHKISLIVGKSTPEAIEFHTLTDLSKAIRAIESIPFLST